MSHPRDAQPELKLVGATLADRYRVVRVIGSGAMGTVFEAQHTSIGRRLAVKVLNRGYGNSAARERFLHEARASGAIAHQHIVPVVDFGVLASGEPYLVMEYADGEPLDRVVLRQAPFPVADGVEICAQILSALEVIHGAGLVHRDIKPANVMLLRVRRPRIMCQILDFGVARALSAAWHRPDLTRVHEVLGTPAYFSPEQATGGGVDPRWDLWAVGTILYELLSGALPFVELDSVEQVLSDLARHRLVPLRQQRVELPAWLLEVVERAHNPVISARFETATLFLQALEQQNAYPEGDESADAKTSLFVRVEINTPAPELLNRLAGEGDLTEVMPQPFDSQATRPELPSLRGRPWPEEAFDDEATTDDGGREMGLAPGHFAGGGQHQAPEAGHLGIGGGRNLGPDPGHLAGARERSAPAGPQTTPIQRIPPEAVDEDQAPLPAERIRETDPVGPAAPRQRVWVMVVLGLVIAVAAGMIVFFGSRLL